MRTEISHFWLGFFEKENDFFDFLGEDPNYYNDESDLEEKYISKFAESQGENWIDHDLMECGFQSSDFPFAERFKGYSYSKKWIPEIERRIKTPKIEKVNSIVFVSKRAIKKPIDVIRANFSLIYIGEIEYEIQD